MLLATVADVYSKKRSITVMDPLLSIDDREDLRLLLQAQVASTALFCNGRVDFRVLGRMAGGSTHLASVQTAAAQVDTAFS